jgi:hypothetical protein
MTSATIKPASGAGGRHAEVDAVASGRITAQPDL